MPSTGRFVGAQAAPPDFVPRGHSSTTRVTGSLARPAWPTPPPRPATEVGGAWGDTADLEPLTTTTTPSSTADQIMERLVGAVLRRLPAPPGEAPREAPPAPPRMAPPVPPLPPAPAPSEPRPEHKREDPPAIDPVPEPTGPPPVVDPPAPPDFEPKGFLYNDRYFARFHPAGGIDVDDVDAVERRTAKSVMSYLVEEEPDVDDFGITKIKRRRVHPERDRDLLTVNPRAYWIIDVHGVEGDGTRRVIPTVMNEDGATFVDPRIGRW